MCALLIGISAMLNLKVVVAGHLSKDSLVNQTFIFRNNKVAVSCTFKSL